MGARIFLIKVFFDMHVFKSRGHADMSTFAFRHTSVPKSRVSTRACPISTSVFLPI